MNNWKICINVQYLWSKAKTRAPVNTVDKFIKLFTDTYIHESLHIVINNSYEDPDDKYDFGQELMVWELMEEKMSKKTRTYYEKEYDTR